jgi:hypothetical protein
MTKLKKNLAKPIEPCGAEDCFCVPKCKCDDTCERTDEGVFTCLCECHYDQEKEKRLG